MDHTANAPSTSPLIAISAISLRVIPNHRIRGLSGRHAPARYSPFSFRLCPAGRGFNGTMLAMRALYRRQADCQIKHLASNQPILPCLSDGSSSGNFVRPVPVGFVGHDLGRLFHGFIRRDNRRRHFGRGLRLDRVRLRDFRFAGHALITLGATAVFHCSMKNVLRRTPQPTHGAEHMEPFAQSAFS